VVRLACGLGQGGNEMSSGGRSSVPCQERWGLTKRGGKSLKKKKRIKGKKAEYPGGRPGKRDRTPDVHRVDRDRAGQSTKITLRTGKGRFPESGRLKNCLSKRSAYIRTGKMESWKAPKPESIPSKSPKKRSKERKCQDETLGGGLTGGGGANSSSIRRNRAG